MRRGRTQKSTVGRWRPEHARSTPNVCRGMCEHTLGIVRWQGSCLCKFGWFVRGAKAGRLITSICGDTERWGSLHSQTQTCRRGSGDGRWRRQRTPPSPVPDRAPGRPGVGRARSTRRRVDGGNGDETPMAFVATGAIHATICSRCAHNGMLPRTRMRPEGTDARVRNIRPGIGRTDGRTGTTGLTDIPGVEVEEKVEDGAEPGAEGKAGAAGKAGEPKNTRPDRTVAQATRDTKRIRETSDGMANTTGDAVTTADMMAATGDGLDWTADAGRNGGSVQPLTDTQAGRRNHGDGMLW